jgi:hypothetical protein
MSELEIGQMLFGNPTEEYSVPRENWVSGPFQILIDAITEKTGEKKDYGYAPHFSNDFFTILPYYWGYEEDEMNKPNFVIPSENFRLYWYKYPFRSSTANEKLTPKRWNYLVQKCIKSLEE